MKAQELRIGNWFKGNWHWGDGKPREINAFDIKDLSDDPQDDFYQPIPLTEEWLLKFGFKPFNFSNKEKGFIIEHKDWSKSIYVRTFAEPNITGFFTVFNRSECHWEEIQFIAKVTNVHQLQNLYFALTGEELEMK